MSASASAGPSGQSPGSRVAPSIRVTAHESLSNCGRRAKGPRVIAASREAPAAPAAARARLTRGASPAVEQSREVRRPRAPSHASRLPRRSGWSSPTARSTTRRNLKVTNSGARHLSRSCLARSAAAASTAALFRGAPWARTGRRAGRSAASTRAATTDIPGVHLSSAALLPPDGQAMTRTGSRSTVESPGLVAARSRPSSDRVPRAIAPAAAAAAATGPTKP